MIELILWTDNPKISIEEISRLIRIVPVEIESIGDIRFYGKDKNQKRTIDVSSIMVSTGYVESIEVEDAVKKMNDLLCNNLKTIIEIVDTYSLNARFCVTINISDKPIISLPSNFIKLMAKLSADIEFDMYLE